MVLAVDIGNTNIVIGEWEGEKLRFVSRIKADSSITEDGYTVQLKDIFELYDVECAKVEGSIISSVVPMITSALAGSLERLTGKRPLVVGPGVKTGLNIRIDDPAQLGSDLVAGGVAAAAKFEKPVIIVDTGTATKISAIDSTGSFVGCAIIPGVRIGIDALAERTASLPQIDLSAPSEIIGRNSVDSMKSGVIYGTACLIDGMIERFEERLGQKASVVATGGFSGCIVPYCRREIIHDPYLLLEGLMLIYKKNTASKA